MEYRYNKHKTEFVGVSAMSTNPMINLISTNQFFKNKIKYFVIDGNQDNFTMRVYRDSSSKPGYLSCDNYKFIDRKQVGKVVKDKSIKYSQKDIPINAIKFVIKGNDIYSMFELDEHVIKSLEKLIEN